MAKQNLALTTTVQDEPHVTHKHTYQPPHTCYLCIFVYVFVCLFARLYYFSSGLYTLKHKRETLLTATKYMLETSERCNKSEPAFRLVASADLILVCSGACVLVSFLEFVSMLLAPPRLLCWFPERHSCSPGNLNVPFRSGRVHETCNACNICQTLYACIAMCNISTTSACRSLLWASSILRKGFEQTTYSITSFVHSCDQLNNSAEESRSQDTTDCSNKTIRIQSGRWWGWSWRRRWRRRRRCRGGRGCRARRWRWTG